MRIARIGKLLSTTLLAMFLGAGGSLLWHAGTTKAVSVVGTFTIPQSPVVSRIICPSSQTCYVSGGNSNAHQLVARIINGQVISVVDTGVHPDEDIGCSDDNTCYIAYGDGFFNVVVVTLIGGSLGDTQVIYHTQGIYFEQGIECVSSAVCYLYGQGSQNGNSTGAVVPIQDGIARSDKILEIPGVYGVQSMDCPDSSVCYAVTENDVKLVTITNGNITNSVGIPGVGGAAGGPIVCSTAATCYVAAFYGNGTSAVIPTMNGQLGTPQTIPQVTKMAGLACSTISACYAVGYIDTGCCSPSHSAFIPIINGIVQTNNVAEDLAGTTGWTSIACPTAALCYATGGVVVLLNVSVASKLAYTTEPPAAVTVGQSFTTQVSVEDAGGNPVTADGSTAVTLSATGGSGKLNCTVNPQTDSAGVASFSCSVDQPGTYTLHAAASGLTGADSTTVTVGIDLSITQVSSAPSAVPGHPFTFTLDVSHTSPVPATGVVVKDTLPANVTLLSATSSLGTCSGTGTLTCTLGSVPGSTDVAVNIVVRPLTTPGTSMTNTASVSGAQPDPNPGNNNNTLTVPVGTPSPAQQPLSPGTMPSSGVIGFLFHQHIVSPFDCADSPDPTVSHQGIDIWTNSDGTGTSDSSPEGNAVYAAYGGTVVGIFDASDRPATGAAGSPSNTASILLIDHGIIGGVHLYTLYAHMANADGSATYIDQTLRVGAKVGAGQMLGHQGNATGPDSPNTLLNGHYITHLHFETKTTASVGNEIDPSPYLGRQLNRCQAGYPAFGSEFP